MAKPTLILIISCLLVSILSVHARRQGRVAEEETNFPDHACLGNEKLLKLHFFVQDLSVNHPNTTTYEVAHASITANSPTRFGTVRVIDDLITAEPDANSHPLGRMQGLVTRSGLTTLAITMNVNIYFTEGQFANSTLSILGRNQISSDVRELVVAGGTGILRFASGYAIQTTNSFGNEVAVLEYYVYTTYNPRIINLDDVELKCNKFACICT